MTWIDWIYPWVLVGVGTVVAIAWGKWEECDYQSTASKLKDVAIMLCIGAIGGPLLITFIVLAQIYQEIHWRWSMRKVKRTRFSGNLTVEDKLRRHTIVEAKAADKRIDEAWVEEAAWPETDIYDDMQAIEMDESGKWK